MKSRVVLSLIAAWALLLSTFAVSVETDRTWYLAGEAMIISIKADDAIIAYAELCDTQGLAAGVVIGLKEGKGSGVIELPSDLHSGYYVLSAYTRDNATVSHQLVAIVNPLRKSADDDIQWVSEDYIEERGRRKEEGDYLGGKNLSQENSPSSFLETHRSA